MKYKLVKKHILFTYIARQVYTKSSGSFIFPK